MLAAVIVGVSGGSAGASPGASRGSTFSDGRYIVTFADEPVASYDGYVAGYAATRPGRGERLNPNSAAVRAWQQRLQSGHDAALRLIGAAKLYDYTVTNNGVTAELTGGQAAALAARPDVISVVRDHMSQPDTTYSPTFLGLDAPGGLWDQLGGADQAGAGVVVGVIDTGIWPESEAFAGGTGIPIPPTWHGRCVPGERFSPNACNDKLIGARYFVQGFGIRNLPVNEFISARDGNGHGSHTASTAAGNNGTTVTIDGNLVGTGSGMAPGAKVAAYKVCWEARPNGDAGCFDSDSVAAINQAVLDGVDVLNYSIGSTTESNVLDPVEQAFRGASNAGVFVANSADNSGPGASTIDHPSPWLTTVAAATFRQAYQAVELGNGARYVGASITPSLPTLTPLVTSVSVKLASASDSDAALCAPGTLDPAKAAGKIVECDRGVVARIDKSFEVQRAGGVGMILANVSPNSLNADYHPIPTVHVDEVARAAILTYIASAGAAATAKIVPLTEAELAAVPDVPEIADFSSRGPSTTTDGDILKPDIAAPGVDVVAAVAPPFNHGRSWDFYSGTSMASPHIAGIGALIMARHPDWLPSEIKSSMMTTARDTVSSADDPFAQGAGFVNPNGAADPGLVYPTTPDEYRQYLVSLGVGFAPPYDTLTPITASNLNQASISVGGLAGAETVTRRVRNVGSAPAIYRSTVNVPGFNAVITPRALTLAPGAEKTFTVTFTRTTAPLGEWATGSLIWSGGGGHSVRSPIALEPVAISAPTEVHGDASASGAVDFEVTPGFSGTLNTTLHGLVGVAPVSDSVAAGPFDINNPNADADTKLYTVTVPADTSVARFSVDAASDTADLDLFVYLDGELVDLSASGASDEEVTLIAPAAGTYDVYVNGFAAPGGPAAYAISNFVVGSADLPNGDVSTGVPVTTGTPVTLTASWTGLDPALRWLGLITYEGADDDVTVFSVG